MTQHSFSPLSLIAVFAGVIEASALASLPFLSDDNQMIYTWFLVGFPFFLTVLFFLTLNFNTDSLFTPEHSGTLQTAQEPEKELLPHTTTPRPMKGGPLDIYARAPDNENAMVIALSGPESRKIYERHVLSLIDRPYTSTRRWVFYNLDHGTAIHLSVSPTQEDEAFADPSHPP